MTDCLNREWFVWLENRNYKVAFAISFQDSFGRKKNWNGRVSIGRSWRRQSRRSYKSYHAISRMKKAKYGALISWPRWEHHQNNDLSEIKKMNSLQKVSNSNFWRVKETKSKIWVEWIDFFNSGWKEVCDKLMFLVELYCENSDYWCWWNYHKVRRVRPTASSLWKKLGS